MKLKGGDSNKRFQNTFFKHQVKGKRVHKEFQNADQKPSSFWSSQKNDIDASDEVTALNVIALMSTFRR
jgi:hypothetical protein